METLTNFEILIYIYLGLTLTTLMYPVVLFFRVAFVNFIFMVILTSLVVLFKLDLGHACMIAMQEDSLKDIYIILGIGVVWMFFLRINDGYDSLLDTLFLGFFPVLTVYLWPSVVLVSDLGSIVNVGLFFIIYGSFIYNKTIVEAVFAVKFMGDDFY